MGHATGGRAAGASRTERGVVYKEAGRELVLREEIHNWDRTDDFATHST